tara:strand:- start:2794 stop:2988 length:195 start_codon:yes stop_codon:yes gene_type:complete
MKEKTKLVLLMEEFGNWWKSQDNPSVPDFVQYKINKNKLEDVTLVTGQLIQLSELLGYIVDGKS